MSEDRVFVYACICGTELHLRRGTKDKCPYCKKWYHYDGNDVLECKDPISDSSVGLPYRTVCGGDWRAFEKACSELVDQGYDPCGGMHHYFTGDTWGEDHYSQAFYRKQKSRVDYKFLKELRCAAEDPKEIDAVTEELRRLKEEASRAAQLEQGIKSSMIFTFAHHELTLEGNWEDAQVIVSIHVVGGLQLPSPVVNRVDIRLPLPLLGFALWHEHMEFKSVEEQRRETEDQLLAHMDIDSTTRMVLTEYADGRLELKEYLP